MSSSFNQRRRCTFANAAAHMMRRASLTALLFICGATIASANDVLGWQQTRWGMSEQQARVALGKEALTISPPERYKELYAPLQATMQISGYPIEAILQFSNQSKTLSQVLLRAKSGGIGLWATLRDMLTEKYGRPYQRGRAREWRFKTTVIELNHLAISGIFDQVSVRYYPASKYKDDTQKL